MKSAYAVSLAALVTLALASPVAAKAPSEKVLATLANVGSVPWAGLVADKSGALYGTATGFNTREHKGCGNVFQLTPPTGTGQPWTYSVLHSFVLGTSDGCGPFAALIVDPSGTLYGTTNSGGATWGGTVFSLTPPAAGSTSWTETLLFQFHNDTPFAPVLRDASGVLFGTTFWGGIGRGSVFELVPPAQGQTNWTRTILYSFQGGADGQGPDAGLVKDATGAFYGTTYYGGTGTNCSGGQGCGTVFELMPPAAGQTAWTETVLYTFTGGTDGGAPYAGLTLDKSGALYGDTEFGGDPDVNGGVIFKLTPPGAGQTSWTESVIHTFEGPDGASPKDSLIIDASGALLGTTYGGGELNKGTVFQLSPPAGGQTAWTETVLHSFAGNPRDGENPIGGVIRNAAHDLFGTTSTGGKSRGGTVFEVTP